MKVNDTEIRFQVWDTAGQERFRSLIPSYIRDSSVAVVVYDICDMRSFEAVDRWVTDIRDQRGTEVLIILVGNKYDLETIR